MGNDSLTRKWCLCNRGTLFLINSESKLDKTHKGG